MMKAKRGAQPGNKNAVKAQTKTPWATRLPDEIIEKIITQAAKRGLNQATYIEWLVNNDKGCK